MISMISFIFQADYCGIIRCQINANTARHTSCIIYGLNEIHRQYIYIVRTPEEILVAQLRDLPHLDFLRDEGRSELLTFMCTEEIANVAVVVGGGHSPRIESSKKEQKGLNDICNGIHNDD